MRIASSEYAMMPLMQQQYSNMPAERYQSPLSSYVLQPPKRILDPESSSYPFQERILIMDTVGPI